MSRALQPDDASQVIGLDTNIVVRMLVQDDLAQSAKVEVLMRTLTPAYPGFVSHPVLMELVWVLSSRYEYDRTQVAHVLELLLRAVELKVDQPDIVWSVLRAYRQTRCDFADLLIEQTCSAAGCDETVTFDVGSSKRTGLRLLR